MARCNRITISLDTKPGRSLAQPTRRARRRPAPAAPRAISIALLLCVGIAVGWAQPKDPPPSQKDSSTPPPKTSPPTPAPPSKAQAPPPQSQSDKEQMRGLDEQIQEVKSDVLKITAELSQLEEKLMYPSGTQVAIFVSLAKGDTLRLDAVRLKIDGQLAAHYIYSFKELDALRKGGVQRIYVGNVATGDHKLEVVVDGKTEGGADFTRTEQFAFRKEVKPKLVGLTVAGSGNPPITLGEW